MKMNVQLITMWYNEEDFAPFFLKHYSWVDKIHLIIDADTNDSTRSIVGQYKNVVVEEFKFPNMFDDSIKINKFNSKYSEIDGDFVIAVDSDEFIFDNNLNPNIKDYLTKKDKKVIFSRLWNVYRHISENDLDINKSVMEQRRHGILNLHGFPHIPYTKPNIVKCGMSKVKWGLGCHSVIISGRSIKFNAICPDFVECSDILNGSHWCMADKDISIKRRIEGRKFRWSDMNKKKRMGETK